MLEVKFYDTVDDSLLKFAVIISLSNGKWVFCKHKERDTYEAPGGHREVGEDILETAKRELQEETPKLLRRFLTKTPSLPILDRVPMRLRPASLHVMRQRSPLPVRSISFPFWTV